ncbi:MAG: hypothetical protein ACYTXA_24720 [Nostoc sp.]
MAIRPAYGQFPSRPAPFISKGQFTANIALVELRDAQEKLNEEKSKTATVPVVPPTPVAGQSPVVTPTSTPITPVPTAPSESAIPKQN